jgi:hypothetical protein
LPPSPQHRDALPATAHVRISIDPRVSPPNRAPRHQASLP